MFRVVTDKTGIDNKAERLKAALENFQSDVLVGGAREVAKWSPVDTGAYMDSHNVESGIVGSMPGISSEGRPRFQDKSSYEMAAVARMEQQVEAMEDKSIATIYNNAEHAQDVEYRWGYEPYTATYREMTRIVDEARNKNFK